MRRFRGFTLIELMLVMVIMASVIYAGTQYFERKALQMRQDRITQQMQQLLSASLAYYVAHGNWPPAIDNLYGLYLPPVYTTTNPLFSPFNTNYSLAGTVPTSGTSLPLVYVVVQIPAFYGSDSIAKVIAGTLPLAFTTSDPGTQAAAPTVQACTANAACYVVASVNIPGQNLNNARAINFAGVYRNGGCVPVPQCPVDTNGNTMKAEVVIVPIQVQGANQPTASGQPLKTWPIQSFTAYPRGDGTQTEPPSCTNPNVTQTCYIQGTPPAGQKYWRACLQVYTSRGMVSVNNQDDWPKDTSWGNKVSLMAVTHCVVTGEPSGSPFNFWTR